MKKIFFSISMLIAFTALHAQTLDRSIRPEPGPAPTINLAEAQSFTLQNGLKVFVVENHKLPVVTYSIQLDIRPELQGEQTGYKDMVGSLITSGTETRSKDQFDEEVDEIAASIAASSEGMYGQSLIHHQEKLLELMSDALLNANFQQSELDKLKTQHLSALATNLNEPDAMLSNVSKVLNFGKNHPYGEIMTEETVDNITLEDCNNYYKTYFRPNVAYMAVVGDITLEKAKELVTKYFGKWESAEVPVTTYPKVEQPQNTLVHFVPRDGAVQSVIGITYPIDLKPGTPEAVKVRTMNEILGGSSQGRLFLNLREDKAWTYGSYSSMSVDDISGRATLYAKARNVVTDSSITEIIKEMNLIRDEKVSDEDLQNMLNYMSGTFAIGLESPQTIAQYAINIERYNMPKDYYKNYLKSINSVTLDDVQQMAQRYIRPEQANIVVVGNQSEAEKLKKFSSTGELLFYDNYGNPIKPAETKDASGVEVQDVINNYIDAIGGKEAIKSLKNLTLEAVGEQMGQQFSIKMVTASPNQFKQVITAQGMEVMKVIVDGDKGYASQMGGAKMDLPEEEVKNYKEQADLQALLNPEKHGITYTLKGIEEIEGNETYKVEKMSGKSGKKTEQFYDVNSGLLVREISQNEMNGQQIVSIMTFSDYREVKDGNGYKTPFSMVTTGTMSMKMNISSATANKNLKDSEFK